MKPVHSHQKEAVPTESVSRRPSASFTPAYKEIVGLTKAFDHEWKYYGKKHGWQLKVVRKGKAFLYLTPQEKSFRIGLAVREKEKERLLNSSLPPKTKEELATAKKYPEGYPLRLEIKSKTDMRAVHVVLEVLKELRP
jgi:hypothetical protein